MQTDPFYTVLAQVGFTVLSFWLAIAQLRRGDLLRSRERRRLAHSVSVQFALPGVMSLLALADPGGRTLWRAAFVVSAVIGAGAVLALRDRGARPLTKAAQAATLLLYAGIALVALLPVDRLPVRPLVAEGVLLSSLLFVGLNVAFSLLFAPDDAA